MLLRFNQLLSATILLGSLTLTALAQSATATLSGFVADENGGYIPNTEIEVLNNATALLRKTKTNGEGWFTVPLLPPGNYSLTARSDGFAVIHHPSITLNVNDSLTTLIRMKPGSINDTITITGEPLLLKDSPAVGTVVDRQFAENLPLNGRSFQSLISVTPGVILTVMAVTHPGQLSVNGQRTNANYLMVDGVSGNFGMSFTHANGNPIPAFSAFGGTNNLVSEDALQEFSIQSSTYAPEFGRTNGGQISLVTRSGSNTFHGAVYNYLRNDALDANDWFANQQELARPPMRQNDFGGVFGGPIQKDRVFFFFSYEGLRLRQPRFTTTIVPSLSLRESVPSALLPFLDLHPLPNGQEFTNSQGQPTGLSPLSAGYSDPSSLDATSLRLDHKITDRLNLYARYNYAPSESRSRIQSSLSTFQASQFQTQTLTASATYTPRNKLIDEFRLNWSRQNVATLFDIDDFGNARPLPDSALFPSFATRADSLFTLQIGQPFVAVGNFRTGIQRQFNLVNNLTYASGNHQSKFGIDYRRLTPAYKPFKYNLRYDTNFEVTPLLAGKAFVAEVANDGPFFPIFDNLSLFAQDTWQLNPRLTLTYGLRWEYNPRPSEKNSRFPYSATGVEDSNSIQVIRSGNPHNNASHDNFAPRFGLAYQISDGKWQRIFRGGMGIYHDLGTDNFGSYFMYGFSPFGTSKTNFQQHVTIPVDLTRLQPLAFNGNTPWQVIVFAGEDKLPYSLQWNVAIDQSFGVHQSMTATYAGIIGRRLPWLESRFLQRSNPNFFSALVCHNSASSDYHALQIQYQRRLTRGLQALGSYSWSHSIDNISSTGVPLLQGPNGGVDDIDISQNRASSDFDVRHSVVGSVVFELPAFKASGVLKPLLENWSLSSIIRVQTATPFNVGINANNSARPDLVPGQPLFIDDPNVGGGRRINRNAFSIQSGSRQGTFGRNVLRNFGFSQTDVGIHRKFKLTEHIGLQLRMEVFNLFNHPNFIITNTVLRSPLFGQATNMLGRGLGGQNPGIGLNPLYQVGGPRSTQLALKLIF